jgi:HEPN domain-containing protein
MESAREEMIEAGLSTLRVDELIERAKESIERGDAYSLLSLLNQTISLKQKAFQIKKDITETEERIKKIKQNKMGLANAEKLFNETLYEFELNNYEGAEELIKEIEKEIVGVMKEKSSILIARVVDYRESAAGLGINDVAINNTLNVLHGITKPGDVDKLLLLIEETENMNQALILLINVKEEINHMREMGLKTVRVENEFKEAKLTFELGNYKKTVTIANQISGLKQKALEIKKGIEEVETKIGYAQQNNLDVIEIRQLLDSAAEEFELNNYEEAERLIERSKRRLEEIKAGSLFQLALGRGEKRFNVVGFLRNNWKQTAGVVVVIIVLGIIAGKIFSARIIKLRLKRLNKELDIIEELIKKSQEDYYKKKAISKDSYETAIDRLQIRMVRIKEKIPVLEAKLKK